MTVDASKIKWASFSSYEGPVYFGSKSFVLPVNPTFLQKCMAIIAAVEGLVDAVNMYDSGIVSLGTVQWIERGNMAVSDMMGYVADRVGLAYVLRCLAPGLKSSSATFRKSSSGKWRFFLERDGKEQEVPSTALQRECFLGCDGKKGSWTPTTVSLARTWCAAFASVWDSEEACRAQLDFSGDRLFSWFVTSNAKKILFSDPSEDGWKGALKAIYLSFAVNIPSIADRNLVIANKNSKFDKWSRSWCLDVIHQLVYGSGVPIWLVRYSGLVKRVESLFGVDLPANAKDLASKSWQDVPEQIPVSMQPIIPAIVPLPIDEDKSDVIESNRESVPVSDLPVFPPVPTPVPTPTKKSNHIVFVVIAIIGGSTTLFSNILDSCR